MNYPQNLTIPIIQLRPRMNSTEWDKSDSNLKTNSPNLSAMNIRNEKTFQSSEIPFTIKKLERLYKTKKYPHKRIWQVGMIMKVRLEAMNTLQKAFPASSSQRFTVL